MRAISEVVNERQCVIDETIRGLLRELFKPKLTRKGQLFALTLGQLLFEGASKYHEYSPVFYESIGKVSSHNSDSNKNGSGILYWLIYGVMRAANRSNEEDCSDRHLLKCALDYDLLPLLVWARDKRPLLRQLKKKAWSNRKLRLRLKEDGSSTGELIEWFIDNRVFRLYSGTNYAVSIGEPGDRLIKRLETLKAHPELPTSTVINLLRMNMIDADAFDGKE